jgi:hypothetical protein
MLPQMSNDDLKQFFKPELTLAEALRQQHDGDDEGEGGNEYEKAVREERERQAENGNANGDRKKKIAAELRKIQTTPDGTHNAPTYVITAEQMATELLRRLGREILKPGQTVMQFTVEIRNLMNALGLTERNAFKDAYTHPPAVQPNVEPNGAEMSLARPPLTPEKEEEAVGRLLNPHGYRPPVSAALSIEEQRHDQVVSELAPEIAPPVDFVPAPRDDHGEPWTAAEREELESLLRRANKLVRRLKPGRQRIMLVRYIGEASSTLESTSPIGMRASKKILEDFGAAVAAGEYATGGT